MNDTAPLDRFGMIVVGLRNDAMKWFDRACCGNWKGFRYARLQKDLGELSPDALSVCRRALLTALDEALHGFLFALYENEEHVKILVDGVDLQNVSDGLHGELFGPDGWFAKFGEDLYSEDSV